MNVVMVNFGEPKGVRGHKISGSLGACVSCKEQKDRQEDLFFILAWVGLEANLCNREITHRR